MLNVEETDSCDEVVVIGGSTTVICSACSEILKPLSPLHHKIDKKKQNIQMNFLF